MTRVVSKGLTSSVCRSLLDAAGRRGTAATLSVARGLQRRALDRAGRRALAPAAHQLAALADRLPAGAALVGRRLFRGAGARPAPPAPPGPRARGATLGGDLLRTVPPANAPERRSRR